MIFNALSNDVLRLCMILHGSSTSCHKNSIRVMCQRLIDAQHHSVVKSNDKTFIFTKEKKKEE